MAAADARGGGARRKAAWPRLGLLLLVAAAAAQRAGASCHWSSDGNETRAALCTVPALEPAGVAALSPSLEGALKLRLACSSVHRLESSVAGESWQRLAQLHELLIEACRITALPRLAFQPLQELKRLQIVSSAGEPTPNWATAGGPRGLELDPEALVGLRELQALELLDTGLRSLPKGLLCSLSNLKLLNLTGNALANVSEAIRALGPEEGEGRAGRADCHRDLRALDLSHNELRLLPEDEALAGLRQLQELLLQHNAIEAVSGDALAGLTSLRVLNISYNSLERLPPETFTNTRDLREIHLQQNRLRELPRALFARMEHLLVLNLAGNRLGSDSVNDTLFQGLIRLIVLNLSYNSLTQISEAMFKDLGALQILDLKNNSISHIERNAFRPLYNLHTLELSENRLRTIGPQLFNGLFVLNRLTLSGNIVSSIDSLAFRNCSDLKELDLSGNELTSVPEALRNLALLKTLDLGENHITGFQNGSFQNLQQLTGLRLIGNEIGNLTRGMLWDLPSLQILNLARNKVQQIEQYTFERNTRLEAIRLDGNFLTDINGIFASIASLLLLNLSENHIEWFDYAMIPSNLKWLDIHGNFIERLGNYYKIRDSRVRTLDASHNRITELGPTSVPDSVELLFINNNYISLVRPNTFSDKANLTRVDMYANMIETMELGALRLVHVPESRPLPEFYLGGNPFNCNCSMDWLPVINNMSALRQHPRVMDLDNAMCRVSGPRGSAVVPASLARPEQFLCRYEAHCFALCHCCDFDACDCEMTCPADCKCYHDQTWNNNVVDCSGLGAHEIPRRIPMDATEVYLDGNELRELQNHVFIGRKNMRALFVNGSGIESIQNRTFNGLNNLQVLHLEENRLRELRGFEFEHLGHLRELYLQNNLIEHIGNLTLLPLHSLELLRLDGNRLSTFPVWQVALNPRLGEIALSGNPWSCRCKFLQELSSWVADNSHRVPDASEVFCLDSETRPPYRRQVNVNETACSESYAQGGLGVIDGLLFSDYLPQAMAVFSALLLLLVLAILGFIFREPVRTWAYSRYGVRFWPGKAQVPGADEERERLYDGYLCYSPKDEDFVLHSIAAELEHGPAGLRLCLHHRDLPCLRTPAPVVLEAAEASKRLVLVLTRNFLQTEWCRFEFRAALHESLRGRLSQLVMILAGPIAREAEADPELRPYLRTAVLLRWGEKRFWERARYALPPPNDPLARKHASLYRRNVNTYTLEGRPEKALPASANHNHHQPGQQQHRHQQQPQAPHSPGQHLYKDQPPAYSSGLGGATVLEPEPPEGPRQSPQPAPRLTMNRAYEEPECPGGGLGSGGRRPLSEHIYSSIDSDYSTLERASWRHHNHNHHHHQHHHQIQQIPPGGGQAYLV